MATLSEVLQKRVLAAVTDLRHELVEAGLADGLVDEIGVKETGQGVKVHFFASSAAKAADYKVNEVPVEKAAPVRRAKRDA